MPRTSALNYADASFGVTFPGFLPFMPSQWRWMGNCWPSTNLWCLTLVVVLPRPRSELWRPTPIHCCKAGQRTARAERIWPRSFRFVSLSNKMNCETPMSKTMLLDIRRKEKGTPQAAKMQPINISAWYCIVTFVLLEFLIKYVVP